MSRPSDLIQGTLDLLILKTISIEPKHGWAIAKRIQQVSDDALLVMQGALYQALPSRAARLDFSQMANDGDGAGGEILSIDEDRRSTTRERTGAVGTPLQCNWARDPDGVGV